MDRMMFSIVTESSRGFTEGSANYESASTYVMTCLSSENLSVLRSNLQTVDSMLRSTIKSNSRY